MTNYFIKNNKLYEIFELTYPNKAGFTDMLTPLEVKSVDYVADFSSNEAELIIDNNIINLLKDQFTLNYIDDIYMINFDFEKILKALNIEINEDEFYYDINYNIEYRYSSYSKYEDTILDIAELI